MLFHSSQDAGLWLKPFPALPVWAMGLEPSPLTPPTP